MNKGIRFGYARVSTSSQKLDLQLERLADCDRTFHEKDSGKSGKNRPGLQKALNLLIVTLAGFVATAQPVG